MARPGFKTKLVVSNAVNQKGNKQPVPGVYTIHFQRRKAYSHSVELSPSAASVCNSLHTFTSGAASCSSPIHSRQFFLETPLPLCNLYFSFSSCLLSFPCDSSFPSAWLPEPHLFRQNISSRFTSASQDFHAASSHRPSTVAPTSEKGSAFSPGKYDPESLSTMGRVAYVPPYCSPTVLPFFNSVEAFLVIYLIKFYWNDNGQ